MGFKGAAGLKKEEDSGKAYMHGRQRAAGFMFYKEIPTSTMFTRVWRQFRGK